MPSPLVESVSPYSFAADATAHVCDPLPTLANGDLLEAWVVNDGDATVATPDGWEARTSAADGTQVRLSVFVRKSDGSDSGGTVDFVTSGAERATIQIYRVLAAQWSGVLADVLVGTAETRTSLPVATPNPPALNGPNGAQDYLWIAGSGVDGNKSYTAAPTDYTDLINTSQGAGAGCAVGTARRELNAASEDPDGFTLSANDDWVAMLGVIPPAGGVTEPELNADLGSESDVGNDVALTTEQRLGIEQGVESDLASDVSLSTEPVFVVELASESDTAVDIQIETQVSEPEFLVELASESDVASDLFLATEKALVLEQAIESDVGVDLSLTVAPALDVDLASESDIAQDPVLIAESVIEIEQAQESDFASDNLFGPDSAEPQFLNGLATERDEGIDVVLAPEPLFEVESTTVSEIAFDVVFSTEQAIVIEVASESDIAEEADFGPAVGFDADLASESDLATDPILATEPVFVVEVANESDTTESAVFGPEPVLALELAQETNQAFDPQIFSGEPQPEFITELATEINLAFDIRFDPVIVRASKGRDYAIKNRGKDHRDRTYSGQGGRDP